MAAFSPQAVCKCHITEETAIWGMNLAFPDDALEDGALHWYHGACKKVGNPYTNNVYKQKLLKFPFPVCVICDESFVVLKTDDGIVCFFCLEDLDD